MKEQKSLEMDDSKESSTVRTHGDSLMDQYTSWMSRDFVSEEDLRSETGEYGLYKNTHGKTIGILRSVSALHSIVASSILIWMICRSHKGLDTTYHRLLLGLCIADIILSSSQAHFNAMSPAEVDYLVWNAKGTDTTCIAQGFLMFMGSIAGLCYNCSINIYSLVVVKYETPDGDIRTKVEPFLHFVPVVLALSLSILRIIGHHYNADPNGVCFHGMYDPPHCYGYKIDETNDSFDAHGIRAEAYTYHQYEYEYSYDIPCGRGLEGAFVSDIMGLIVYTLPIIIMVALLSIIYKAVRDQEHKSGQYRFSSYRASVSIVNNDNNASQPEIDFSRSSSTFGRLTSWVSSSVSRAMQSVRSSQSAASAPRSRMVFYRAMAYTMAWFLSYGFFIVGFLFISGGEYPIALTYINVILMPLQGLWNLMIFMYPRVVAARQKLERERRRETRMRMNASTNSNNTNGNLLGNISWCQILKEAFLSRGSNCRNSRRGSLHSSRRSLRASANEWIGRCRGRSSSLPSACASATPLSTNTAISSGHSFLGTSVAEATTTTTTAVRDKKRTSTVAFLDDVDGIGKKQNDSEEEKSEIQSPYNSAPPSPLRKKMGCNFAANISNEGTPNDTGMMHFVDNEEDNNGESASGSVDVGVEMVSFRTNQDPEIDPPRSSPQAD